MLSATAWKKPCVRSGPRPMISAWCSTRCQRIDITRQRELINRAIARLDAQAVAMEIEIGDPHKGTVGALSRLGTDWCMVALTALGSIGSLTSAGIAIHGLGEADTRIRQAQACIVEVEQRLALTEFITDHVGPWHDEQPDPPYPLPHDADAYLDFDGIWLPADGDGEPIQVPAGMPLNEWRLWREQYHGSEVHDRDDLLRLLDRWR